jgi:hypothetical protein
MTILLLLDLELIENRGTGSHARLSVACPQGASQGAAST